MRILVNITETGHPVLNVLEITDAMYDEGIDGFSVYDTDSNHYYIGGINRIRANDICRELLKYGYADLTAFGSICDYED